MKTQIGNIEIHRNLDGRLTTVNAVLPFWIKQNEDSFFQVGVPLMGIEFFVQHEEDIDQALKEAVKCLLIASEKIGNGLENDLQDTGWEKPMSLTSSRMKSKKNEDSLMNFSTKDPLMVSIINNSYSSALQLTI